VLLIHMPIPDAFTVRRVRAESALVLFIPSMTPLVFLHIANENSRKVAKFAIINGWLHRMINVRCYFLLVERKFKDKSVHYNLIRKEYTFFLVVIVELVFSSSLLGSSGG